MNKERSGSRRERPFELFDALDAGLRCRLERSWDGLSNDPVPSAAVFVHADLAAEHLLVDADSGRLTGIIDFEGATLGEPAVDFVGLLTAFGIPATRRIAAAYVGDASDVEALWPRILLYWQLRAAESLGLALGTGSARAVIARRIVELERRFAAADEG